MPGLCLKCCVIITPIDPHKICVQCRSHFPCEVDCEVCASWDPRYSQRVEKNVSVAAAKDSGQSFEHNRVELRPHVSGKTSKENPGFNRHTVEADVHVSASNSTSGISELFKNIISNVNTREIEEFTLRDRPRGVSVSMTSHENNKDGGDARVHSLSSEPIIIEDVGSDTVTITPETLPSDHVPPGQDDPEDMISIPTGSEGQMPSQASCSDSSNKRKRIPDSEQQKEAKFLSFVQEELSRAVLKLHKDYKKFTQRHVS